MPKLFISDERMLQLMAWAIQEGLVETERDYMEKIQFPRTNITQVRRGRQGFTKANILKACQLTGASADWIFGFTNHRLRKQPRKAMEVLKEAVRAVELDFKGNSRQ